MKIVDISHHDSGKDLTKYDGTIIKATQGVDYIDPALEANVSAARMSGRPWGLYHYLSFATPVTDQIAEFVAMLDKYPGWTLRPVLDVEFDSNINRVLPEDINARVKAFADAIPHLVLYANPDMLSHLDAAVCGKLPLWQAEYNAAPRNIPGYTRIGWQYRENPDESDFTGDILMPVAAPDPQPAPAVREYQRKLNHLQIASLAEDGVLGPLTRGAVIKFQGIVGIAQDGVYGPQTDGVYQSIASKPQLRQGTTGPVVRYIQYRVGAQTDGQWGPQTDAAVRAWQGSRGLAADGIVGPATWGAMIGG